MWYIQIGTGKLNLRDSEKGFSPVHFIKPIHSADESYLLFGNQSIILSPLIAVL